MLERQVITMPFARGVDTKTDEKQVEAGKLLELENGVFTTLKSIRKRDGNVALGKTISNDGTQISFGAGLATYGSELLLSNSENIYSHDDGSDGWVSKGPFVSVQVQSNSVVRDTYSQSNQDGAVAPNGLRLFAWQDSSGTKTVRYSIIDSATQQTVVSSALVSLDAIKPRVLVANTTFVIYYVEVSTGILRAATLASTTPNAALSYADLTGVAADAGALNLTSPNYDACVIPGVGIALAYNNREAAGGTTVRLYGLNTPLVQIQAQQTIAYRSRSIAVFPSVPFIASPTSGVTVAFSADNNSAPYTTDVRYFLYDSILTYAYDDVLASSLAGPLNCLCITGCSNSTTERGFDVFWNSSGSLGSGAFRGVTSKATVDPSLSVSSTTNWQRGVTPFARAFSYNGLSHVPVVHESDLQSTYFIVRSDNEIVAKALSSTSGPSLPQYVVAGAYTATDYVMPLVASVSQIDDQTFQVPCLQQLLLSSTGLTTQTGVSYLTLTMDEPVHSFAHAELGSALHFTGGFVQMYDGIDVVEHNFHLFPEYIQTFQFIGGGSMAEGTYTYSVCYEWVDNQNNVHRSFPSIPGTSGVVTFPPGTTTGRVTLRIPYLQLTAKVGTRPVQIVIYRTKADGEILYRLTSLTAPTYNVVNGVSATFDYSDTENDTYLDGKPQLYSQFIAGTNAGTGYELQNEPAPPARLIQLHRNRLWVVDSTNPLHLWYSKENGIGAPVEFTSDFVKQIDPRGGDITALASVDDKLLVFKRSHIFAVIGRGPDSTGANNDLSDAIFVTSDVGCIDPRSVVGTPVGIMFQTAKGIYLIDRSLQVQYVGAAVEAYNGETITSATLMASVNQVRFTLQSGKTLVYDYFVEQWGTFTNQYAVDSLIWLGTPVILRSNGSVLKETPGVFSDAGSPYALKLTTSWLTFANVQGYQRVRRAQILGGWKSPHNLSVDVCVDFNDAVVQSVVVTPQSPTAYGAASPYGLGLYGGTFQLYQWRIDLARQKTQAVRFTIQDLPTATAGEGMSLSNIAFEVGAKQGTAKVPATQIFS
jgi:hypothetical protein